MATYVIGDIHGCFETLQRLLEQLHFVPTEDRLWLVGDLVNRGPQSLEVLRWVKSMGERILTVLGNHDLHLLARWFGVAPPKEKDTLNSVLVAKDRADLLEWLRHRPLLHCEGKQILVHAGLLPQWSIDRALSYSQEVEHALRGTQAVMLLESLSWKRVPGWDDHLTGLTRLGCILKGLTQLRTCASNGSLCLDFTGPPHEAPQGCAPWFSFPGRKSASATVCFGHWATLGLYQAPGIIALDTNCVRGGTLTAVRLEDGAVFQQPKAESEWNFK